LNGKRFQIYQAKKEAFQKCCFHFSCCQEQTGQKPKGILRNVEEKFDSNLIYEDIKKERKRCSSLGDEDILKVWRFVAKTKCSNIMIPGIF